jgi:hypothetical protein
MKRYFYIGAAFLMLGNSVLFGQGDGDVDITSGGVSITDPGSGIITVTPYPIISSPIDFGYSLLANTSGSINISGAIGISMDDATGSAGIDPGWTLLSLTSRSGQVSISGGIFLESFTTSGGAAPVTDFDPLVSYCWQIINAPENNLNIAGGLTLDLSQFYNSYNGVFSTYATTSDLFLTYTPAPEPSTISLLAISVPSVLFLKRRLFRHQDFCSQ